MRFVSPTLFQVSSILETLQKLAENPREVRTNDTYQTLCAPSHYNALAQALEMLSQTAQELEQQTDLQKVCTI